MRKVQQNHERIEDDQSLSYLVFVRVVLESLDGRDDVLRGQLLVRLVDGISGDDGGVGDRPFFAEDLSLELGENRRSEGGREEKVRSLYIKIADW